MVISSANAAYLTSWGATATFSDPNDGAISTAQDILNVWYDADATYHYFRMDIEAAPTTAGSNYASIYGVYIDAIAGGASGGDYNYIPNAITGVDFIVDAHFDTSLTGSFDQWDFHIYDDGSSSWSLGVLDDHQESENSGTTIEWKIARSKIGNEYTFRMATHDGGSATTTYDYAPDIGEGGYYVPEPTMLSVLAIGGCMALIKRRRR